MSEKTKRTKVKKDGIVKRWLGWKTIKQGASWGNEMVTNIKQPSCQIVETFEEAKVRMNFTTEGMKRAYKKFFFQFYSIVFALMLVIFGMTITIFKGEIYFIIPSLVVGVMLSIKGVEYSLRCCQIRHQEMFGVKEFLSTHLYELMPLPLDSKYKLKGEKK